MQADDMKLLREFATSHSGQAFATLVQRHINLVYSVALRRLNNAHEAEEVTQVVFIILAKKAGQLGPETILSGWLYQAAQLTSANFQRAMLRRQRREQEAYMQFTRESEGDPSWQRLNPLLEEAMTRLGKHERDAIVLRFFENRTIREVAEALGLQEAATQKRVNRATEKLRKHFVRHGVHVSATILLASLRANAVQAAPVALAKSVTAAAIAKGAGISGSTLTLIKTTIKLMAWTKMKTTVLVGVGILLVAGTTTLTVKTIAQYREPSVWDNITGRTLQELERAPRAISIRPTKFDAPATGSLEDHGKILGLHQPFDSLVSRAYDVMPCRILPSTILPRGNFDYIVSGSNPPKDALQLAIKNEFGITGKLETRNTDVLLLTVKRRNAPGLVLASDKDPSNLGIGHLTLRGASCAELASYLEYYLGIPVVDQTGLGGHYAINLSWDAQLKWDSADHYYFSNPDGLKQVLLDQLGLELVPGHQPVEMLVMGKAQN